MRAERAKKIRWAYLALGVALLLCLGLIYAWSVFRAPLEEEFGWSKTQISVTFSISMTMFCLGGLASGVAAGKRGPRLTLAACAVCLLAGFSMASQISSLPGIYVTYGGFCGFGVGLDAVISTLMRWFPDKQGLVSGIALMGFGGMLLGALGAGLITALGWRTTFLIFAAAFAAPFVGGDLTRAAALAGLVSIANGAGRVVSGQLFDAAGYRTTMLGISAVYIAASAALTASLKTGSVPVLTAAFLLVGLAYDGVPPVNAAFVADFFGRRHYALNFSIINLNLIAASYLGPLCAGESCAGTFAAILVFALAGAALTLLVKRPVRGGKGIV